LRLLLIGDIVGKPGRDIVVRSAAALRRKYRLDLLLANAENAAAGSGLTPGIYRDLVAAGVDGITLGDHIYKRKEIASVLQQESNIVKPANLPSEAPGREFMVLEAAGAQVAVVSLLGRLFMKPIDCPWKTADRVLTALPGNVKAVVVDFHAEATSEMQLMGRHLDDRVTAVLGTHTHVPTADECILPGGTAFQCDIGMTGPYESIIGRRIDRVLETTITFMPTKFDVARDDVRLSGTIVEFDPQSGRATGIERLCLREDEARRLVQDDAKESSNTPAA